MRSCLKSTQQDRARSIRQCDTCLNGHLYLIEIDQSFAGDTQTRASGLRRSHFLRPNLKIALVVPTIILPNLHAIVQQQTQTPHVPLLHKMGMLIMHVPSLKTTPHGQQP